ncbi:hypothetical protein E2C01_011039 [Portunus trituberculatus]|uniref:Uncharacterized protein n=1 Tax=Portunus trituberculatus TaxID=210409 RepID=A0A5B7DAB8_PORTR|nr:hypothetical protein [Portunus trituberculatus]
MSCSAKFVTCGVPQGDNLRPLGFLFLFIISNGRPEGPDSQLGGEHLENPSPDVSMRGSSTPLTPKHPHPTPLPSFLGLPAP